MTTYREILPYAKHLTFMRGEIRWLAVDSYCFNPDCPCREAALCFIQVPEAGGRRAKPTLTVFYDYRKASTHAPEYSSDSRISEQELMGSLKQAYANLDSLLAQRHLVLKKLFRRTHVRTESPKANVEMGRNKLGATIPARAAAERSTRSAAALELHFLDPREGLHPTLRHAKTT
jgi:hypothetical protein